MAAKGVPTLSLFFFFSELFLTQASDSVHNAISAVLTQAMGCLVLLWVGMSWDLGRGEAKGKAGSSLGCITDGQNYGTSRMCTGLRKARQVNSFCFTVGAG